MEMIVGHRGTKHVLSELWAQNNQAQYGVGNYVFNFFDNFAYEIVDNTHVKIKKGIAMIQGRPIILKEDVVVVIENGSTNYVRKDLIVIRASRVSTIENGDITVIKGTPVLSGAVDPVYYSGDFNVDADFVDYPLYRVNLTGLNIGVVTKLFTETTSIDDSFFGIGSNIESIENDITAIQTTLAKFTAKRAAHVGAKQYRFIWGKSNGSGYVRTNEISTPFTKAEINVPGTVLTGISVEGAGAVAIDYKSVGISDTGGLFLECSTAGAPGISSLVSNSCVAAITLVLNP